MYKMKCSCGKYETAFDFTSPEQVQQAADLHLMLSGRHHIVLSEKLEQGSRIVGSMGKSGQSEPHHGAAGPRVPLIYYGLV
jgi:hypothetical protein